jgi:hypothetical protein
VGERVEGPIFLAASGERLDRHGAARMVARTARVTKRVTPHTLRHAFITAALDAGVRLRDVQEAASHADPRTTMRDDAARVSLDRHATYRAVRDPLARLSLVRQIPRRRDRWLDHSGVPFVCGRPLTWEETRRGANRWRPTKV